MGVAAGDINNDGCVDLYLTNFGSAQMYRNNCDGTFTDVTKQSGTANRAGACRRRSWTSTATAGSTSSSGTT